MNQNHTYDLLAANRLLTDLRQNKNQSIYQFARNAKKTPTTISRIEHGQTNPTTKQLNEILNNLGYKAYLVITKA